MAGPGEIQIGQLGARLRMVPPELRRRIRPEMVRAVRPIVRDARSRASWSTRIPGAISGSVKFRGPRVGLWLRTNAARAPHARPYEGANGQRQFRHPLFGDREHWYSQATRPFLRPAAYEGRGEVAEAAGRALDTALTRAGFG